MLLFIVIYNLLRLLSSTILIADVVPDMISRSFIFEFPWQFGYGSFALYLIGIAQTLADVRKNRFKKKCIFFSKPFFFNRAIK
jgi:hypothetical protein